MATPITPECPPVSPGLNTFMRLGPPWIEDCLQEAFVEVQILPGRDEQAAPAGVFTC